MSLYLERYAHSKRLIYSKPHKDVGIIVTIPVYAEEQLIRSLESIKSCTLPHCAVEVIVLINEGETAPGDISDANHKTYLGASKWVERNSSDQLTFHVLYCNDLPKKHAGVGLARKMAMDEAVKRFEYLKKPGGIIACFDADCTCDNNYLIALENHFKFHPKSPACSIYFEHPLEGELRSVLYSAIIDYELFLRYYVNALRFAGFPLAYQTIGSSMAVKSYAYQKQGGMNRRKAGEDFYFLQRIFKLGGFTELNSTKIIPSPRISHRVPFGTGKAVYDWQSNNELLAYNPKTFVDLKKLMDSINLLFETSIESAWSNFAKSLPQSVSTFLDNKNFLNELSRMNKLSKNQKAFNKNFFHWFDGFMALKYVHHARDNYYPNLPVGVISKELLKLMSFEPLPESNKELLMHFRKKDREFQSS